MQATIENKLSGEDILYSFLEWRVPLCVTLEGINADDGKLLKNW